MAAKERRSDEEAAQAAREHRGHPGTGAAGAVAGAAAGAAAGALAGPAGMLLGGAAGAVLGGMAGGRAGKGVDRLAETNLAAPAEDPVAQDASAGLAARSLGATGLVPLAEPLPAQAGDALQATLSCCIDGEYGLRACAAQARGPLLKATLLHAAERCRAAAADVRSLLEGAGEQPQEDAGALGRGHRGWVPERAVLAGYDDRAVLREAECGTVGTLACLRAALEPPLPQAARRTLEHHLGGFQSDLEDLRRVRQAGAIT